jgi:hypothetical protein
LQPRPCVTQRGAATWLDPRAAKEVSMKKTAADILIDTLQDWGVDTVFGLPPLTILSDKVRELV